MKRWQRAEAAFAVIACRGDGRIAAKDFGVAELSLRNWAHGADLGAVQG